MTVGITVHELSKQFTDGPHVLRDVSFDLPPGSEFAISADTARGISRRSSDSSSTLRSVRSPTAGLSFTIWQLYEGWSESLASRRGSAARRLPPHLLNQPAVNIAYVETAMGVASHADRDQGARRWLLSAAQRAVEQLEDAGILQRAGGAQRNRAWIASARN